MDELLQAGFRIRHNPIGLQPRVRHPAGHAQRLRRGCDAVRNYAGQARHFNAHLSGKRDMNNSSLHRQDGNFRPVCFCMELSAEPENMGVVCGGQKGMMA